MAYRTTPNMGQIIAGHNTKILKPKSQDLPCNCQKSKKEDCPLSGECQKTNVIYQATVIPEDNNTPVETYIGLTSTTFKLRYGNHKFSFNHEDEGGQTALSKHVWALKKKNVKFKINWRIVDRARTYNPVRGTCPLCTLEKYYIIFKPSLSSLNQNDELLKPCPHVDKLLLENT